MIVLLLTMMLARADDRPILSATPPPPKPRVSCDWCVFGNERITGEVIRLSKLKPQAIIKELKGQKACVKIIENGRKAAPGEFGWRSQAGHGAPLVKETKLAGVMGKMLCKGELEIANDCPTIALAADAPFSRVLFEYLHFEQSERDPHWCGLARTFWVRAQTSETWQQARDKDWDAYLLLWHSLGRMKLALEDRIAITKGVIDEAEQRKSFDPNGQKFLDTEKPGAYLTMLNGEYRKKKTGK